MGQLLMPKHDFVDNGLNDYCLTCDLPRYSAVHEALPVTAPHAPVYGSVKGVKGDLWIPDGQVQSEAQQKAKRLGDLTRIYERLVSRAILG